MPNGLVTGGRAPIVFLSEARKRAGYAAGEPPAILAPSGVVHGQASPAATSFENLPFYVESE